MHLLALAFEEINKFHYLRRFFFFFFLMKRVDLSKFLIPKPWRLPGRSTSFPSFSVSGSSGRHSPSVGPEERVRGVGWLVWDMRVGFGFVCFLLLMLFGGTGQGTG